MGFQRQYIRPRVMNLGPDKGYHLVQPFKPSIQEVVWQTSLTVLGRIVGLFRSKAKGTAHTIVGGRTPGRNQPCPCGSGVKYKRCCGSTPQQKEFRMARYLAAAEEKRARFLTGVFRQARVNREKQEETNV